MRGAEAARSDNSDSVTPTPIATGWRAVVADVAGEAPRVQIGQGDDPALAEITDEGPLRSPVRVAARQGPHDESCCVRPGRLFVEVCHPVVADVRGRHHDDLTRIRGIGENLLVSGHRGVEHHFACGHPLGAHTSAAKHGTVGSHQQARCPNVRHRRASLEVTSCVIRPPNKVATTRPVIVCPVHGEFCERDTNGPASQVAVGSMTVT